MKFLNFLVIDFAVDRRSPLPTHITNQLFSHSQPRTTLRPGPGSSESPLLPGSGSPGAASVGRQNRQGRAASSPHIRTWLWKAWVINKQEPLKCNAPSEPLPPTNQNSLSSVSEVDCNSSSKPTSAIVLR